MSINISLTIYDREELFSALSVGMTEEETFRLIKIMTKCGHPIGDKFIIVNNEYGDEWSPYFNMSHLIDSAFPRIFNMRISSSAILTRLRYHGEKTVKGISHVDVHGVAEELRIKLID